MALNGLIIRRMHSTERTTRRVSTLRFTSTNFVPPLDKDYLAQNGAAIASGQTKGRVSERPNDLPPEISARRDESSSFDGSGGWSLPQGLEKFGEPVAETVESPGTANSVVLVSHHYLLDRPEVARRSFSQKQMQIKT
jgi:hypothetical protein